MPGIRAHSHPGWQAAHAARASGRALRRLSGHWQLAGGGQRKFQAFGICEVRAMFAESCAIIRSFPCLGRALKSSATLGMLSNIVKQYPNY